MITNIHIQNFRSIKSADIPLGKMTVLTGANNTGKSSVLYALLVLKELIKDPARKTDMFFNLPFAQLGNYKSVVYNQVENQDISIGVETTINEVQSIWKVTFSKDNIVNIENTLQNEEDITSMKLDISLPFNAPNLNKFEKKINGEPVEVLWDGFSAPSMVRTSSAPIISADIQKTFKEKIAEPVVSPIRETYLIDSSVPYSRGFTQFNFGAVPLQQQISTEDEIATLLATDTDTQNKVSFYLKKVLNDKTFKIHSTIGTALFRMQMQDDSTGLVTDIVNEGAGVNQLLSLFTKILYSKNKFICIDEPEIHLHPSMINKLVDVLFEIIKKENKQLLITTHSEHFINAILRNVAQGNIAKDTARVYYLTKETETAFEYQAINDKGQIEGGLKSFYETELDNIKNFFKIAE